MVSTIVLIASTHFEQKVNLGNMTVCAKIMINVL